MKSIYKTVDLFGNEIIQLVEKEKKSNKSLFDDYDGFSEKFKQKKTTDDCYTPKEVYQAVLNFVSSRFDLSGFRIVRPFYPGGDFENIKYLDNDVVIDNPPFSIISKVSRFYIENKIKFFVFSPHLTLLSADLDCTAIVTGSSIIYDNGANVNTSFLSNLFGDLKILSAPSLYFDICEINGRNKVNLPKYEYPSNVLTVSMVKKFTDNGINFQLNKIDCTHCRGLDSQKTHGKGIFGSGFLLSEKAAAEKAAAEKAAAEKAAAEKAAAEKAAAEKDYIITWTISDREKKIISSLGDR